MRKLIISIFKLVVPVFLVWPFSTYAQNNSFSSTPVEKIAPEIESEIQSLVRKGNLPSLQVAVVSKEQIIWSKSFGNNTGPDYKYMIGSVQKVFNGIAVLQLHEKGMIKIDQDINSYLPFNVRHPKYPDVPVTIGMLLSHRSGLEAFKYQVEWDTRYLNFKKDSIAEPLPDAAFLPLEEFLKASLDPAGFNYDPSVWHFKPGSNYLYSVSAQYILCYLIEKVTGKTYPEYLHKNIFEPLEMNNTMFYKDDSTARFAVPFTRKDRENIELPIWAGERDLIYSTAEDLGKFMIAIMNNGHYRNFQLLKPETIELMQKKHSPGKNIFHLTSNCPFAGYGYGIIQYSNNWFGHGGSTFGYQSLWSFNKSNNKGYIILTNVNGLIYGGKNFNSVWAAVSSVERTIKSEIAPFNYKIFYFVVFVSGILLVIIVSIKRKRKTITPHNK